MIYQQPPLIELKSSFADSKGISVVILREDLNHPQISGNKWWKLKYNLREIIEGGHSKLLTFGGAYSNHLYATAAAAAELGIESISIVRGEETLPLNPTLTFVKTCGMKIHYVSRENYRKKNDPEFIQSLKDMFGEFFLIPEGGTNNLAIKGTQEWASQIAARIEFDYLCVPVGTGGTIAGMINTLPHRKIIGFSSLKGGEFLADEIQPWLTTKNKNWQIETSYHFGGYGKINNELTAFISEFEKTNNIPLDPVYTGKMMFGVYDLLKKGFFDSGSKVLVLHTGGLQGRP